jgi:hypothetical protein
VFPATEPRLCDAGAGGSEARNSSAPLQLRMMAEAYTHASQSIDRLLNEHLEKAASILARCYRKDKEVKDEIDSILQLSSPGQQEASRPPPNSAIPILSRGHVRGHARSSSSQLSVSPPHPRRVMHSNAGPTPPGSSASRSTKGPFASGETILLIDAYEGSLEEHPVRLKNAAIEFSLIREDIANERITSTAPIEGDHHHIVVPNTVNPETCAEVRISESITLTWRRPRSDSTHRTTFFLVSRDVLSTDVLLGYKDSGEGSPGVYARSCCDFIKPLD